MSRQKISKAKKKAIDAFLGRPIQEGESVLVKGKKVNSVHGNDLDCTVTKVLKNGQFKVQPSGRDYDSQHIIDVDDIVLRSTIHIGVDPFEKRSSKLRLVQFTFLPKDAHGLQPWEELGNTK